jgi:hypothetical protein
MGVVGAVADGAGKEACAHGAWVLERQGIFQVNVVVMDDAPEAIFGDEVGLDVDVKGWHAHISGVFGVKPPDFQ